MSGSCGKCWNCNLKYDRFQAHLFAIADFPVLPRIGSLIMLEMWHIVVQGWGQALGNVSRTAPAHGAHKEL